ncbi:MAG: hypothetical protein ILA17_06185 [Ruminococcus sp.]|nr:hypothetical protein [Ruminiclostridium sp.]MBO6302087.1 hypothetical protein [Ruminiclostridium sp.]MBP1537438.1 hypothetical protein [Ruminococcus sp.]
MLKAGTPIYVSTTDVCSWTGKTKQWVGQLANQGTLERVQTEQGQFFRAGDTIKAYTEMLEARAEKEDRELSEAEQDKLKSEASLKKSKATVAALQALEMTGKMHRSEDVAAMTEDLVYAIRGSLLALPGRLAVDLADMDDPAEISEYIRREIYKVMDELSRYEYDPKKYDERVRERLKFDARPRGGEEEEEGE